MRDTRQFRVAVVIMLYAFILPVLLVLISDYVSSQGVRKEYTT